MFFVRGTFWVLPLTYFYLPKSARAYHFSQSVKIITFAAAPLVLTPFVRNRKEPFFEAAVFDSIISTTDNEYWRRQRSHLAEAFMPLSSLARVLPVSLARAKECAARLASLAAGGSHVDMSDFLLHEAQAQLQLALLGVPEEVMDATNERLRGAFMGNPDEGQVGALGKAMRLLMEQAKADKGLALPSDGPDVRGPVLRAIQSSDFGPTTDYGNILLVLFAGHDTTGHTMTWLLFELARQPEVQRELRREVDAFFASLGGRDPGYTDLGGLDLGKGQPSALMESLQMLFFVGTPVNLLFSSQKCQGRTFFPNLSKLFTFAAAPFVSTPFVRNQTCHYQNSPTPRYRGPSMTCFLGLCSITLFCFLAYGGTQHICLQPRTSWTAASPRRCGSGRPWPTAPTASCTLPAPRLGAPFGDHQ